MLDIKFVRDNPDIVKQNIKNKFQDEKLPLVDQVIELYTRQLEAKQGLRPSRSTATPCPSRSAPEGQGQEGAGQAAEYEEQAAALQAQVTREAEEREKLERRRTSWPPRSGRSC